MLLFNKHDDDKDELHSDMPIFRFIPTRREIVQRLVMKGSTLKSPNDLNFLFRRE